MLNQERFKVLSITIAIFAIYGLIGYGVALVTGIMWLGWTTSILLAFVVAHKLRPM
jgi:hypothetical protein